MIISSSSAISDKTKQLCSFGRWFVLTLGLIMLVIASNIIIAIQMDLFGIFRDPRGRLLTTAAHERKIKYFLNEAYVPDNFDGLIIGASASVNWRPAELKGYRFYNESLEGGNASEERKLVEQALSKGHFKVAIVCLYPHVTSSHLLQDGLDKPSRAEVLGSESSLRLEYHVLRERFSHRENTFYPDGSHELPPLVPNLALHTIQDVTQDSQAVQDYRLLTQELMDRGTRVIYVVYPLYEPTYHYNEKMMMAYMQSVKEALPTNPIVDFNSAEYEQFRKDASNYIDEVHLSHSGAERLSLLLNLRLQQTLGTS